MTQAKDGDTVRVHFTGKLDDGTVFATSANRDPLEFTIGKDRTLRGLERAVVGMKQGESKTTLVQADEAYGPRYEEMVVVVDRNKFPPDLKPEIGEEFELRQPDGQFVEVRVTDVSTSSVTLDANHPLAGEALTFDLQLIEIV